MFDDMLHQVLFDLILLNASVVLARYQDGINSDWLNISSILFVFDGHLNFCIWPHPVNNFFLPTVLKTADEPSTEAMGQGHEFLSLICGIADHKALVSSPNILLVFIDMHRLSDLMRLAVNCNNNSGSLMIHSYIHIFVADFLDGMSRHFFDVDGRVGVDLAKHHAN